MSEWRCMWKHVSEDLDNNICEEKIIRGNRRVKSGNQVCGSFSFHRVSGDWWGVVVVKNGWIKSLGSFDRFVLREHSILEGN
jgi:hypothetical protein